MSSSKKMKSADLGTQRALRRLDKYLYTLKWEGKEGLEKYKPKVFNLQNKRNTKAYFQALAEYYEGWFRELFEKLDKDTKYDVYYANREEIIAHREALKKLGVTNDD